MFIKTLKIKNFKCFDSTIDTFKFSVPDGKTLGSGLNIFVGDNNSGKSTVFESIDFLRDNTKKNIEDILNKNAEKNAELSVELTFAGNINDIIENFSQTNKKDVFKKYVYTPAGKSNEYFKLQRSSKDIKAIKLWNNENSKFENETGIDAPLKKLFETNFVWSDTNPNDQTSFGATTICGNLLKEIVKKFEDTEDYSMFSKKFHKTFNDEKSGLRKELNAIEEKTQKIFSEQFSAAKISFHFDELKIDSFFKNTKIKIDDGVPTFMEEKGSGMQRSVALALLQVYADELIKHPDNQKIAKPFFLFIDEPEICLHPQAQMKLLTAILELSKTKQVFISTHSPYFFKHKLLKNFGLFLFKKDEKQKINILNLKKENWGHFPWSPSWGEINYHAYNLPTVEFHNELYGYIQEQTGNFSLSNIEDYFQTKTIELTKQWIKIQSGQPQPPADVTLMTYIRNSMHHPENINNPTYTAPELKQSTDQLINIILNP